MPLPQVMPDILQYLPLLKAHAQMRLLLTTRGMKYWFQLFFPEDNDLLLRRMVPLARKQAAFVRQLVLTTDSKCNRTNAAARVQDLRRFAAPRHRLVSSW